MTTTYETILLETDERGVATVTLNRPDKHNALNGTLIAELADAAEKLAADDKVRRLRIYYAASIPCPNP